MEKHYDRIYAAINLDAINHNTEVIKNGLSEHTKILAVVKTDGYGHGAIPIAKELEGKEEIYGFATATAEEAFILRKIGIKKPILVLGYVFPYAYEEIVKREIRIALFRKDTVELLAREAKIQGKKAYIHIKTDTGMNRIGITPDEEGFQFVEEVIKYPEIEIEGIFTHFAKADQKDKEATLKQLDLFLAFAAMVEERLGIHIPLKHCANSAAALELLQTHLDLVRVGIAMYGLWPSEEIEKWKYPLKPAFSLHSHIIYLKKIGAGEEISYGGTYKTEKETLVATIPVGYGDGFPRSLSNKGFIFIHGKKAPIIGRICMDQFMVDVTHIPGVKEGDKAVLIGEGLEEKITMEEMGILADRFNYELACVIGKRVPRIYYKKEKECYAKDYFDDYSFDKI